jgi:hypothetical protein
MSLAILHQQVQANSQEIAQMVRIQSLQVNWFSQLCQPAAKYRGKGCAADRDKWGWKNQSFRSPFLACALGVVCGARRGMSLAIVGQTSERPASWSIFAELNGHEGPAVIGTGLADANEKGRNIRINHAPATQGDLLDCVSLSWLTPQMDGLFLASPSQRRRFSG